MSWIGELIGSGVGKAIGEIATPFTDAWVKTKQSQAATHKVDKETDRDITIEAYRSDVQLALGQQLLADADRTHWSTRWIRPAFCALAFVWMAASVYLWLFSGAPLDDVVKYLLSGIVGSLFLLRPFEKNKRADLAAAAAAPPKPPTILGRLTGKT
jgi:hypothetical protein